MLSAIGRADPTNGIGLGFMRMDKAREAWGRAARMLTDLSPHERGADEVAFEDRLPYVVDLLAGVRRQIHEHISGSQPHSASMDSWWAAQKTPDRVAITEMRHAQLKRLERGAERRVLTHTNSSAGTFDGRPVNSGDTLTWSEWYVTSGRFEGQRVMEMLSAELESLGSLIRDTEMRLAQDARSS